MCMHGSATCYDWNNYMSTTTIITTILAAMAQDWVGLVLAEITKLAIIIVSLLNHHGNHASCISC